jgi:hypothetical protein
VFLMPRKAGDGRNRGTFRVVCVDYTATGKPGLGFGALICRATRIRVAPKGRKTLKSGHRQDSCLVPESCPRASAQPTTAAT